MITVAEYEYFSIDAMAHYDAARVIVDAIPGYGLERHKPAVGQSHWTPLRCYEVTRLVRMLLGELQRLKVLNEIEMNVVDGRYGSCQHSWIGLIDRRPRRRCSEKTDAEAVSFILDCYSTGQLPPVQLIDVSMNLASQFQADAVGFSVPVFAREVNELAAIVASSDEWRSLLTR